MWEFSSVIEFLFSKQLECEGQTAIYSQNAVTMLVLHSCYTCMFIRLGINETGKNTISMKNICMTQTGEKNRICVRTGSIWMFSILGSVTAVIFNNPVYNELTRLHNVGFHFPVWNLSDTARHILC